MSSSHALLPFEDAIAAILEATTPLPPEMVDLWAASGRVLAETVRATEDVPAHPTSAMDGYAIPESVLQTIAEQGEAQVRVVGEVVAGSPWPNYPLRHGEVLRIFTGGVVPPWAAAIVMQENTVRDGEMVTIRGPVKPRAYIRDAGSDVQAGQEVLSVGSVLTPPALGLLSSMGVEKVSVGSRPRVGILVTGSEVVRAGPLAPGQVRDSNGPTLEAAALLCGAGEVLQDAAPDDFATLTLAVKDLLPKVDLLLCAGGVSIGDYDLVKEVLESLGARRILWGVAQRPGKPLYAAILHERLVLGLPGNPASALATFLCQGWPALRKMTGARPERVRSRAVVAAPAKKSPGFTAMLRGRRWIDGGRVLVETSGPQESHQMLPFARADCLILGPPDCDVLEPGTEVEVVPFPWENGP